MFSVSLDNEERLSVARLQIANRVLKFLSIDRGTTDSKRDYDCQNYECQQLTHPGGLLDSS
jgi:hypothetical protein